jgi:S1-C subfamily serine protease
MTAMQTNRTHRTISAVGVVMVAALIAAGCGSPTSTAQASGKRDEPAARPTKTTKPRATTTTLPAAVVSALDVVPNVVRQLQPSVVTIGTGDGIGSGVVWSSGGLIVTNAHVVGTNKDVTVDFADGKQVRGTVKATDIVTDLAVVQADRKGLTPARFETKLPDLGSLAVVIGSPLGFTNSVTSGVISGEGRTIPNSAQESQSLVDLIQTDAGVSPGNSGGALANQDGEVTGIVEAYIPPSAGAVSLGFAIPAGTVVDVVKQLIATGKAQHSFLGVSTAAITPEIQRQLDLDQSTGAAIVRITRNGPAERAELEQGDVIIQIGSTEVTSPETLLLALRRTKPGQTVPVTFIRDGEQRTAQVTLADRPAE